MAKFANFVGSAYEMEHATATTERCINWYPAYLESPGAKAPMVLLPTPGVETFATSEDNPVRAVFTDPATGRGFTVIGDQFYEFDENGNLTNLTEGLAFSTFSAFALDVGTDPATISSNGDGGSELFITSGDNGYTFDLATNTGIEAFSAFDADMGASIDGYFLALDADDSALFISDLNDGATWDPLQFQQRSKAPDRWVSLDVEGADIFLFGGQTTELWYNAGTSPFPFAFQPPVIPFGIAAPFSKKGIAGSMLWLAQTRNGVSGVVQAVGTSARIISDGAIAHAIQEYANDSVVSDAVADAYEYKGHPFYMLTFPTAGVTWVYDLSTQKWHQRGTWNTSTSSYDAWRPLYHAVAFGKHLIGDRSDGVIYEMRGDFTTDVGDVDIRRVRRAPVISFENKRVRYNRFELDLEVGLGNAVAPGDDPQVTLMYSRDAGKTWATAGNRSAGSGALGEYRTRVFWNRLGTARNACFEIVVTDQIPWRITGAYLEARVL